MKTNFNRKIYLIVSILILALFLFIIPSSKAQDMADYTAYPTFITSGTTPNLLLMIDNSASIYDLAYIDNGNMPARESSYCYDQTYSSNNTYVGYFEKDKVYTYNFGSNRFESGSFPGICSNQINGELCVNIVSGSPSTVNEFTAKGNYLNWLTASKLDVQKTILTGGKYDTSTNELISESRGCVGRGFIKEALTADYVEGGANTSLGVVFSISGPPNEYNPSGVSNGGQTYLEIYEGNYDEVLCQNAIQQINYASNPSAIRSSVEDCLSYDPKAGPGTQYCLLDSSKTCTVDSDCDNVAIAGDCTSGNPSSRVCQAPSDPSMIGLSCVQDEDCDTIASSVGPCVGGSSHGAEVTSKVVFNQSMQECWQIWSGSKTEVGNDAWSAEAPKCADLYSEYKICNGGDDDGITCTSDADCSGGGTCIGGPAALRPGNPALMCNPTYAGYCATTTDNWATTTWVANGYADPETCFRKKYGEYCGDVKVPQVIDPSDTPDETAETANVPAIIAEIGVEAQLGSPIANLKVTNYDTTAPTGLLDDFEDKIRFGAMIFNFDGSKDECGDTGDNLYCPKVCSTTTSLTCNTSLDCPSGESCIDVPDNGKDAGKIIHYIGEGTCSVTTSTDCVRDNQCPSGEVCVSDIGDHDSGLIKAIDDIRANTWTPFAEAYYNAIAYFVKGAIFTVEGDPIKEPLLDTDNFDGSKNCIEYECQKNNILIISDGASTSDTHSDMTGKVTTGGFNDGETLSDDETCGNYQGSTYLDDLSYYAKHNNIFNTVDPDLAKAELAQSITTYVVYTGAETSTETGECAPKTLMENTADNGGTVLYNAQSPEDLATSLRTTFMEVSKDAASGSAVSVLATTSEGAGSVYQAYFFPEKTEGFETRNWLGYVQSLFVDQYGNLREDTNGNKGLDLITDKIIEMGYSSELGTAVYKCSDTNGDGVKDSCAPPVYDLAVINAVWKGGEQLWQRDPASRSIFTTINGYDEIAFKTTASATLKPYLRAADASESDNIINWIRGDDLTGITDSGHLNGYRKRDITISGSNNVWKLGDMVHSTPTVVGRPMGNYDLLYNDSSYAKFRLNYHNRRQTVYVGSNDGMLHAFNAGCFDETNHQYYPDVDGSGNCTTGTHTLGEELWAFIPRGLLPHLKWNTDPNYTHVYYVDSKPKIADVNIFTTDATHTEGWGTILIGGFRYGGKDISWTSGGTDYTASPEYFALDITDPLNPRLLWTFSHPDLGLSMSYPAISKIGDEWYAVFGSGATDYDIESNFTTFQDGNVFVLKISGALNGVINTWTLNSNFWKIPTGNSSAFLADPISVDVDIDYDVDVFYIGENYDSGTAPNALMHRITTAEGVQTNPALWTLSTLGDVGTISVNKDDAKRITAAPSAAMDDRANLWVFFGTGQFLGADDKNQLDTGAFYAIKDGCWRGTCATSYSSLLDVSGATVQTDGSVAGVAGACAGGVSTWGDLLTASYSCDGWALYFKNIVENIDFMGDPLEHSGERMVTKPLVLGGLVMWATYIPGKDICSIEGESNLYAVYYESGTGYKKYVFSDQKNATSPSTTVARTKRLGKGMPSSLSAQITAGGTAKGFIQQSTGSILGIESVTPLSLQSDVTGWKSEQIP